MNCHECQLGRLVATTVPYLYPYRGRILIAPRVAAQVCDVCGSTDYDLDFVQRLQQLLDVQPRWSGAERTESLPQAPTNDSDWPGARRSG